jgi:hypothetical protein
MQEPKWTAAHEAVLDLFEHLVRHEREVEEGVEKLDAGTDLNDKARNELEQQILRSKCKESMYRIMADKMLKIVTDNRSIPNMENHMHSVKTLEEYVQTFMHGNAVGRNLTDMVSSSRRSGM